jgi:hypothetical protein
MKIRIFGGVLVAALALTSLAEAQTGLVNARKHNETARIREGINSGSLTHSEAHHLIKRERDLNKSIRKAEAKGYLTRRENRRLLRKEARINRAIVRKKTNSRVRK